MANILAKTGNYRNLFWVFYCTFCVLFSSILLPIAEASTIWKISGQEVLKFEYSDDLAKAKIKQLDRRLAQIVATLNPDQPWAIDILPYPNAATNPTISPVPIPPEQVKSAAIRLQGQVLLEVTEADLRLHQASSVMELANTWARSLANLFSQPIVRQVLVAAVEMPAQVNFSGITYYLKPEIALDRGLFRTTGKRVDGRFVFWEVPPDKKAYEVGETTIKEPKAPLTKIYLLNRYLQFMPYLNQEH
ncbi:hypothetical protein [Tumidithrix helvetica]|uniref:hypothetical protein n=1 Tax=Tumidithrix helvetica TaxID=3457545 RepID=UPI003CC60222